MPQAHSASELQANLTNREATLKIIYTSKNRLKMIARAPQPGCQSTQGDQIPMSVS
jgi:hypothetical protein